MSASGPFVGAADPSGTPGLPVAVSRGSSSGAVEFPVGTDGVVRHWLAQGPIVAPVTAPPSAPVTGPNTQGVGPSLGGIAAAGSPFGEGGRWTMNYWAWHPAVQATKARLYGVATEGVGPAPSRLPCSVWPNGNDGLATTPVRDGTPPAGPDGDWSWLSLRDDMADFSRFSFTPTLFRGVLFTELRCDLAGSYRADILTVGPVSLMVDDTSVAVHAGPFGYVNPHPVPVTLELDAGVHPLWLWGDMIGLREARLGLGLVFRDDDAARHLRVRLPIGRHDPEAWRRAERAINAVHVKRYDFGDEVQEAVVDANAATEGSRLRMQVVVAGRPTAAASSAWTTTDASRPGASFGFPVTADVLAEHADAAGETPLELVLRPVEDLPMERRIAFLAGGATYRHMPYGTYASRKAEALEHLAGVRFDVMGALAAVLTGRVALVRSDALDASIAFLEERRDTADFHAVGLMVLLYRCRELARRTGDDPLDPVDRARIERALRGFKFWIDEPGLDAMCYFTENHQILFHVAEHLAGRFWPHERFGNDGRQGSAKAEAAASRIRRWIGRRLESGFSEWDSNAYLAMDAFALLALIEFTEDEALRGMAGSLLDVLFFRLATQSFRGTHGSSHGRCYVAALRSGRAEGTTGLQRIAWGMGSFNGETRATGMLAMSTRYEVPPELRLVGSDLPPMLVTRARSHGAFLPRADMRADGFDVRTLTRRTPSSMLSAVVDHRPGAQGIQEHVWQATLSPDAVVFTTLPGNLLEHGNARPNAWAGSARLPHVGMHDRTVLCLYDLEGTYGNAREADEGPADREGDRVGLGFSHAYFPTASFDAWSLEGSWAFARYGDGYVALWGDGTLELTRSGPFLGLELRSRGEGRAWLCRVGSVAEDGAFDGFKDALLALPPPTTGKGAPPALAWRSPEGDDLELRWRTGLSLTGRPIETAAFPHYGNAYTQVRAEDRVMSIAVHGRTRTIDRAPAWSGDEG